MKAQFKDVINESVYDTAILRIDKKIFADKLNINTSSSKTDICIFGPNFTSFIFKIKTSFDNFCKKHSWKRGTGRRFGMETENVQNFHKKYFLRKSV